MAISNHRLVALEDGEVVFRWSDSAILANMAAEAPQKKALSTHGHPNAHLSGNTNCSANDGTISEHRY